MVIKNFNFFYQKYLQNIKYVLYLHSQYGTRVSVAKVLKKTQTRK